MGCIGVTNSLLSPHAKMQLQSLHSLLRAGSLLPHHPKPQDFRIKSIKYRVVDCGIHTEARKFRSCVNKKIARARPECPKLFISTTVHFEYEVQGAISGRYERGREEAPVLGQPVVPCRVNIRVWTPYITSTSYSRRRVQKIDMHPGVIRCAPLACRTSR